MSRYFTSDLHLGSANINKYAHRPFDDAHHAKTQLIELINCTVAPSSSLIHVGDFMLAGSDRHDTVEDVGLKYTFRDYMKLINPRLLLLEGNHDSGHNCEADAKSLTLDLNQNYRNVYVSHFPSDHKDYHGPFASCKAAPKIVLCGHVHDKWLLKYDAIRHVVNVNVGVDVWDYRPVRDSQITEMLDFLFMHGKDLFMTKDRGFIANIAWNRDRWNKWVDDVNKGLAAAREQRKRERYEKKGLTPEERERRKIEAMKAKGLIK